MGEEYKEGKNQKKRLRDFEIEKIIKTFRAGKSVDDFAAAVSYEDIAAKGYGISAGLYFDVKIEHVDITPKEFNRRVSEIGINLDTIDAEYNKLFKDVKKGLKGLGL